jgi:hypothetical protein
MSNRRARNREYRRQFDQNRRHGLERRHRNKLQHLTQRQDHTMTTPEPDDRVLLVHNGQGQPIGVFNLDDITSDGARYAYQLAAIADDPDAVGRLHRETLQRVGHQEYGYLAAAALNFMTIALLDGAFEAFRQLGFDPKVVLQQIVTAEEATREEPS